MSTMTVRDEFALAALRSTLERAPIPADEEQVNRWALSAYGVADAMMLARRRTGAEGATYVHLKSGNRYRILAIATVEADLSEVVIYYSMTDLKVWSRPRAEFFDGRFEPVK